MAKVAEEKDADYKQFAKKMKFSTPAELEENYKEFPPFNAFEHYRKNPTSLKQYRKNKKERFVIQPAAIQLLQRFFTGNGEPNPIFENPYKIDEDLTSETLKDEHFQMEWKSFNRESVQVWSKTLRIDGSRLQLHSNLQDVDDPKLVFAIGSDSCRHVTLLIILEDGQYHTAGFGYFDKSLTTRFGYNEGYILTADYDMPKADHTSKILWIANYDENIMQRLQEELNKVYEIKYEVHLTYIDLENFEYFLSPYFHLKSTEKYNKYAEITRYLPKQFSANNCLMWVENILGIRFNSYDPDFVNAVDQTDMSLFMEAKLGGAGDSEITEIIGKIQQHLRSSKGGKKQKRKTNTRKKKIQKLRKTTENLN